MAATSSGSTGETPSTIDDTTGPVPADSSAPRAMPIARIHITRDSMVARHRDAVGAERDADADLALTLDHGVGQHGVES